MDPKGTYEEEVSEEPVDYSKKYIERDHRHSEREVAVVQESQARASAARKKEFAEREKVDLFGDYAETDLDQPTDYSLRYAENDTDDDEKQAGHEYFPGSVQEDTVKTYCTEGTPYETPFNFSTATSMSDLRLEDSKESSVDAGKRPAKKPVLPSVPSSLRHKEEERTVPRSHQHLEKNPGTVKEARNLSDGDCVPLGDEKLNSYYESSTPDAFPRVNSLSSLGSTNAQQNVSETSSKASTEDAKPVPSTEITTNVVSQASSSPEVSETPSEPDIPAEKSSARVIDKEGKMVTFGGEDFYAEQTPLMFSRSSSLGSLSGFEQFSIHDDRSSIVSDFSRRTSGIVSPSELPDSPTQTVPPSPGNRKNQCADFVSKIPEEAVRPSIRHLSFTKAPATRTSVFEDDIATFKEESTPIEFSTATSLSSLTIDDEVKIPETCETQPSQEAVPKNLAEEPKDTRELPKERVTFAEKACQVEVEKEQEPVSDADEGDDDDEDILAACISRGMQNNRYRQSFKTNNVLKQPAPVEAPRVLGRCPRNTPINRLVARVPVAPENPTATIKRNPPMEAVAAPDTVHVYCTEDTPADISPVGSQSNLSALSMPSLREDIIKEDKEPSEIECHRNDLSDESSNLSGEDEKILDECIQSGMPKVRQITPPPANSIPCVPKSEIVTQRFNKCGTPSSSPVESGHNKNPVLSKPICPARIENEPDLSDDSLNHSDDEAILTECIRSAMPKARLNISPLTGLSSQTVEKCKPSTSHPPKSNTNVPYFQPRYSEHSKKSHLEREPKYDEACRIRNPERPVVPFESNICLSDEEEDEDSMLAQCIRSGIPRALNVSSITPSMSQTKKIEHCPKPRTLENPPNPYFRSRTCSNRDVATQVQPTSIHKPRSPQEPEASNFSRFPVKPSDRNRYVPRNFRSGRPGIPERSNQPIHASTCRHPVAPSEHQEVVRSVSNGLSARPHVANCGSPMANGSENYEEEDASRSSLGKSNIPPSRHSSVSSLSEEGSLGSIEEWALLELCINSALPRNRCRLKGTKVNEAAICANHEEREPIGEDSYSICSYSSYVCKT